MSPGLIHHTVSHISWGEIKLIWRHTELPCRYKIANICHTLLELGGGRWEVGTTPSKAITRDQTGSVVRGAVPVTAVEFCIRTKIS